MKQFIDFKTYDIIIGIDPGVNTGVAVWDNRQKQLLQVVTLQHHQAVAIVLAFVAMKNKVFVRFEDARMRQWFGKSGPEKLQGAGSIKRDCSLWEEWCIMNDIPFEEVAPKDNKTKMDSETFKKYTKWDKQTNEHGRDAAWLVYGI